MPTAKKNELVALLARMLLEECDLEHVAWAEESQELLLTRGGTTFYPVHFKLRSPSHILAQAVEHICEQLEAPSFSTKR